MAQGQYIAILEGDDFWLPHKLATQMDAMQKNPEAILCWSSAYSANTDLSETYELHPKEQAQNKKYYNNTPVGNLYNVIFDDFLPPLTFLIRKQALTKIGGFLQLYKFPAVDLPTVLALARTGQFIFLDEVLGYWRVHAYQVTKTYSSDILESGRRIFMDNYHLLTPEQKQLLRFDENYIDHFYKAAEVISYARAGRFKLVRGQYKDARTDFVHALSHHGVAAPVWKLRAAIGWTLSWLKLDVEFLAKVLGRASYKK
jgi:hypothetical protein